ncbi:lipoxygenase family protein [Massilia sp. W12]|uniref:lipoxygenase family protein n=1 Tax=Massilia sp. W12 TaxID=3126507 RepID=UPI0030D5A828
MKNANPLLPGLAPKSGKSMLGPAPVLPQHAKRKQAAARQLQLQMSRVRYNYTHTYLDGVPFSAGVPRGERFTADYKMMVAHSIEQIVDNFRRVMMGLFNVYAQSGRADMAQDLLHLANGLHKVYQESGKEGATALLKSLLRYTLPEAAHQHLRAESEDDFAALFASFRTPAALCIESAPWMQADEQPCLQDWYFGWLQIAGFNTTLLRGVYPDGAEHGMRHAMPLSAVLQKIPLTDAAFQSICGDAQMSLQRAAELKRLYVCDYAILDGAKNSELFGLTRYVCAPLALFYWNPQPGPGYPPGRAAMQPLAIQLAQAHDAESAPIFTPNDSMGAQDENGLKWLLAKHLVNVMQAIHHESVAHFGECHLMPEPAILAANRQLAQEHPLMILLKPHFRFTISINDTARKSLIAPGGVVACNVGPDLHSSLEMVRQTFLQRQFDDCNPERLFALRGVQDLPEFPFRDDTLLIWRAIKNYVSAYLRLYYRHDGDVREDMELQGFIHELCSPRHAAWQGLRGLRATGDPARPYEIDSLEYLIELIAGLIYVCGPKHAAVNYAQFPLMSYAPCVIGTVYRPMPTRATQLQQRADLLPWYPPLDLVLYTFSFEYLLSDIQYDTLGHYPGSPCTPYFQDDKARDVVAAFQAELAQIEVEIRKRNQHRVLPYVYQLPSLIPNSVSI